MWRAATEIAPVGLEEPKEDAFAALPPVARAYVACLIALGTLCVAVAAFFADTDRPGLFLALLVLSCLASTLKLSLPLSRGASSLSLSYAINMVALILLGPHRTTLVAIIGAWSQSTFRMREPNSLHRTLFSMASIALTAETAGLVFGLATTGDADTLFALLQPLGAATIVYFLLNTGTVAGAIAASARTSFTRVWYDNFLWTGPSYFVGATVAALASVIIERGSYYWWVGLIAVPTYLTYRSYRMFIQRIDDERAQVRRISDVHLATIEALALAIEAKDRTTQAQVRKIQAYAAGLAKAVGMSEDEIRGLKTAALLHDIGNLAVPEHILAKPNTLTDEEFQKVKIHPRVGAEIVKDVPFPYPVSVFIVAHHEHWDGQGYPNGVAGEAIPQGARVLAVVDCFMSLLAERPYRRARSRRDAIAILHQNAGTMLDPTLVRTFVRILPSLESALASEGAEPAAALNAVGAVAHDGSNPLEDIAGAHREAQVLYDIAQALGSSLGISDTMGLITEKLTGLVPFSTCALFLWKKDLGLFSCAYVSGVDGERIEHLTARDIDSLIAALVARGDDTLRPHTLQSALASQLLLNEERVGALTICHTTADFYSGDHRRVLDRVSQQAASVIYNSIIFERTQEESFTDPLTSLPNRRYMLANLTQQLALAERQGTPLVVVMMDVDGFKPINDRFGHPVGDRALREIAVVLRSMIRPYDLCVRYAGDEFVIVFWECDTTQARRRLREVEDAIAAIHFEGRPGEVVPLSLSAGSSAYPSDGQTSDELFAVADKRMYQVKQTRKRVRNGVPAGDETPNHVLAEV